MNKFLGKNTPSIRESNMELLRVLCMLFIVCGHITLAHKSDLMGDSSYYINYFFRSFAVVAVNVYVLISGYYGIKEAWGNKYNGNGVFCSFCIILSMGRHS